MFKKQEVVEKYDKVEAILGKNFNVNGNVNASGSVRIEGYLKGELTVEGNLVIGETAVIEGLVKATNVHMSGKITGNLYVTGQLKLTSTAIMIGDIEVDKFIIDEGATFQGNCIMTSIVNNKENEALKLEEQNN
ncbi:MAG TPA: polymer-forming cytoskeletal protein [Eubacteriaceae bacterium]|jgi:cytoskeletal protein CcmA (bactofilin family)|nr:polymer-forming cytoskeletal protein [Eubacteriaceae bacterium]